MLNIAAPSAISNTKFSFLFIVPSRSIFVTFDDQWRHHIVYVHTNPPIECIVEFDVRISAFLTIRREFIARSLYLKPSLRNQRCA